jgi:hypothetical protein
VVTLGTTKKMVQELKLIKPFPLNIVDDFFLMFVYYVPKYMVLSFYWNKNS